VNSERRHQAVAFFVRQGWTAEQSAGIVANLEAESGLRSDAVGDGGAAYGIAQWHPDRQSLFAGLLGKPIQGSSFEDQLYFVHAELQRSEHKAGDALRDCATAAAAGACVSRRYERPADREGEAAKRAALAERIFASYTAAAQDHASNAIPDAPIPTQPETPKQPQTPEFKPSLQPESAMPAILAQLLPMVLGMFSPGGQAQLQPITSRPADQIGPFLLSLFSQIGQQTGVVPAGQQIKTDAEAVAAVAELAKQKQANADLVASIERHALTYLADLAPLFDKLAAADAAENAARIAGANAASERAQKEKWDMTPWLVWIAGGTATVLVLALLGAIIWQATTGERTIDTALIGLAGPLLAIAMSVWREIFSYRFDGNPASNASATLNREIIAASKRVQ
jgi:hypothetical protein